MTDDLISRADAISIPILPKEHRKQFKSFDDAFETGWNEAMSCINVLPSAQPKQGEWIPCEERMPKEGQMVLTTIRGHDVIIVQDGETREEAIERVWNSVIYVSVGFIGSDGWCGADGYPQIVHPVAWMPLPQPYDGARMTERSE